MMTDLVSSAAAWSAEVDLDQAIADLVARDAVDLPPYPAVAVKLERLVDGGDFGLDDVARLVSGDPTLAADVLRVANSACYSRGDHVASLPQAVSRVGAGELARMAVASCLGARALTRGPLARLRRQVWHDALASAVLARELARSRHLPQDEAFACGLLHDFGKVLALECLERIAAGTRHPRPMPSAFWDAVVEHHHLRLGALLSQRWGLPRLVADAIRLHHAEQPVAGAAMPELVEVIAVSDRLVRLLDDRSAVGHADVAAIQSLSEADTNALIRGIEVVPGFVAAFEREPAAPDRGLVQPPALPALAPLRPSARRSVRVRVAGAEFAVTGFARHQLVMVGTVPLPEGMLLEVEMADEPPAPFHARVLLCWEEAGRFSVVLMPFALGGPALLRWQGLARLAEG